ncbi:phosphatase PAP2 family protein [Streptococcus ovuberis]|uniref:Phosphatase PAP2 family protein n=1 Tax=Streptococcus ovuberis TaxID=1936207 RepID=A0A7X6MWS6_9STRE|nr:phosphatase PAP2 family protein [Streptococcus ovuberis]NKZ19815.1 phosphatase PAP2 family protein [Streptococcus ovuberis]
MKNKQAYLTWGTVALLFFVILGYTIKFYPDQISFLDVNLQNGVRGTLPDLLTRFYRQVTILGNSPVILLYTALMASYFYYQKRWKAEGAFLLGNLVILGLLSTLFKIVYNRPRPSLVYLIEDPIGASFPSWHAASSLTVAITLAIILQQRLNRVWLRRVLQVVLLLLALVTGISRIYLGVHYPSDILAGWLLSVAVTLILFPFYDQKRFEWRFKSKQR